MLNSLSIRDIVLLEKLDLEMSDGLCVFTGETGAGKSILLDALSLALGARADAGLIRQGKDQGSITVAFDIPVDHPIIELLKSQDFEIEDEDIILRRVLGKDGRSRATINGQPVGVATLREMSQYLVEIHGQHDAHSLLQATQHRDLLDQFAEAGGLVQSCEQTFQTWRKIKAELQAAEAAIVAAREEEEYNRHALQELQSLDPQPDEEDELTSQRAFLKQGQKIIDGLSEAMIKFTDGDGPEERLQSALRSLERISDAAGAHLDDALAKLEQAYDTVGHARDAIEAAGEAMDLDPHRLEQVEDRLFALRDLARKHRTSVAALPDLIDHFSGQIANVEDGEENIQRLTSDLKTARQKYETAIGKLSAKRRAAGKKLTTAVLKELPALAMEKAKFATDIEPIDPSDWGPTGAERVQFLFSTNPGMPPAALNKIASGGELSRIMLALKVALPGTGPGKAMIFDEVDAGVGGATAAKVGRRLSKLSEQGQVLVVTHSPQVAALGSAHYLIRKETKKSGTVTNVTLLDRDGREEEVARMLAGQEITDEARAAALKLLENVS